MGVNKIFESDLAGSVDKQQVEVYRVSLRTSFPHLLLVGRLSLSPVCIAASGSSLGKLSLQVKNKENNKFSGEIYVFL